ncbi:type I polyketide synthase [Nocardiopsis nanhaiensis]
MTASIAVVGLSCRLPGHIRSPQQFWDALMAGRDLVTNHTGDHPRASLLPAAILTEPELRFDADHFGLSPTEVEVMDPQQKMILELVDEAFQDAGLSLASHRGQRVGLWVGSSCLDQALLRLGPGQGGTMVDTAGALPSMLANRASRHRLIDWTGPSETIDTACSASLVAIHRARQALECGEVDLAVVAGTNILGLDTHTRMFAASGVLANDGRVHAFDRAGTGFVRGEGGAVIVLQRTADTRATATRARAVLAGSLTNSDGAKQPIGTPNPDGQIDLLERAYAVAGINPHHVDYIEGHGTGTPVGDSAEGRAAGRVLGQGRSEDSPLWVGSVKTNIGHLEGAAGIIGLIKVILSLEHGVIPATIHHTFPIPALGRMNVRVPTTAQPWPRRAHTPTAGVSALGFGGTNAHVIVRQGPQQAQHHQSARAGRAHVVPISASSPTALAATATAWAQDLTGHGSALDAVAATAAHRRDHHTGARAATVATSVPDLAHGLNQVGRGSTGLRVAGPRRSRGQPQVVFVYPGHGAHPHGPVGAHGLGTESAFAHTYERAMAAVSSARGGRPPGAFDGLACIQPVQWAWQVAATELLRSWGVVPDVVVGHSLGEIAAAHTAQALSLDHAATVVVERSLLLQEQVGAGALAATSLPLEQAREVTRSRPPLAVAAINGPASTVLSGPLAQLQDLAQELDSQGQWVRVIADAPPAHSPLVAEQAERLPDLLTSIGARVVSTCLISTATGVRLKGTEMDGPYWGRQLREPVQLHQALTSVIEPGRPVVLVEIGARSVLASSLTSTLAQADRRYEVDPPVVTTAGPAEPQENLLMALAHLYTHGLTPRWPTPTTHTPVRLPLRAWAHDQSERPETTTVRLREMDHDQAFQVIGDQITQLVHGLISGATGEWDPRSDWQELGLESLARAHLYTQLITRLPDLAGLDAHAAQHARTTSELAQAAHRHLLSSPRAQPVPEGVIRPG